MTTKSDLQAILDEMRTDDRRTRVEPPTVEEMLAYRAGELSEAEEERVREQLIRWPELMRALMTPYADDDAEALPPEVVERQWKAMRSEISGARVLSFPNVLTAIAATLAIVFGGLLWQAKLELRQPRAVPQITLMPDANRGNGNQPTPVTMSGDAVLLSLTLLGENTFEHYRVEITGDANRHVWSSGLIRRGEDDTLAVLVPRPFLPAGRYTLILSGVSGERKEQLATYSVRVTQ